MNRPLTIKLSTSTFLVVFLLLNTVTFAQRGARTLPVALDQMVQESQTIVHGTVISARVEPDPQFKNLMTVVVTMQVAETLKGTATKTFEFRQFIWDVRDRLDAASYRKGDELLLFLGPTSRYGLRSPTGLDQGRFRITRVKGRTMAVNGRGNIGLFRGTEKRVGAQGRILTGNTAKLAHEQVTGPVAFSDLKQAILSFSGAAR